MHTLGDLAKKLNRATVYIRGLQARFALPVFGGSKYSDAYLTFLRQIVFLRTLNISEDRLRDLWALEKKLMQLLHVDSTGSQTWFLDACGQTKNRSRRLLLSNHDLGVPLPSGVVQLGLNFEEALPELFVGTEMGEDALRVLRHYLKLHTKILADVADELPHVKAAAQWGRSSSGTSASYGASGGVAVSTHSQEAADGTAMQSENIKIEVEKAAFIEVARVFRRVYRPQGVDQVSVFSADGFLTIEFRGGGARIPCKSQHAVIAVMEGKDFSSLAAAHRLEKNLSGLIQLTFRPAFGEFATPLGGVKAIIEVH